MMDMLEHYGRETERAIREGLSPEKYPRVPAECIKTIVGPNYNEVRLEAFVALICHVLPTEVAAKVTKHMGYKIKSHPFAANYELATKPFGEGGTHRVYFLEAPTSELSSWVVKLPKRPRLSPEDHIKQQKGECERIKAVFSTLPNLVPPEYYFIMDGRDGKPTAAMLQEYKGDLRDIFTEIPREDLRQLLEEQSQFREELAEFLHVFKANPDLLAEGLDFTGTRNLCVLKEDDNYHLALMDPHFITDLSVESIIEVKNRADYLASLLQESSI